MRIKSSLLNIAAGIGNQLIIAVLSFISRTVFIESLGIEYLGINALFTSILAMLSLAEAGIGSSIIYNLYKPVADKDEPRILAWMKLYRSAYLYIAGVIMLVGLAVLPFLTHFIKDSNVEHLHLIYLLFLLNTSVPYLFVYKQSFLNVNQKNYIITAVYSITFIVSSIVKIVILHVTQNYLLFLLLDSLLTIVASILLSIVVNRKYPFLKKKSTYKLEPDSKRSFVKNMKAIMLQNIGNYFIFGVDSILISTFISVAAVGLYSNYKMLIDLCRTFVNQVFTNLYHSVGNLIAEESKEKVYRIYKATSLLNFWLYSFISIELYLLLDPFIRIWLGEQFLMGKATVILLVLTFFERGMRNTITTVKTTSGIFHEDRYVPIAQAVINLGVSLLLVHSLGIAGIFAGTLISSVAMPFWTTPYLVYRKVFHLPIRYYFFRYLHFLGVGIIAYLLSAATMLYLPSSQLFGVVMQGIVAAVVVNLVFVCAFWRTAEFRYLMQIANGLLAKLSPLKGIRRKSTSA